MKEPEARKYGYRCPDCHDPLSEVRGDYFCPQCLMESIEAENHQDDNGHGNGV